MPTHHCLSTTARSRVLSHVQTSCANALQMYSMLIADHKIKCVCVCVMTCDCIAPFTQIYYTSALDDNSHRVQCLPTVHTPAISLLTSNTSHACDCRARRTRREFCCKDHLLSSHRANSSRARHIVRSFRSSVHATRQQNQAAGDHVSSNIDKHPTHMCPPRFVQ